MVARIHLALAALVVVAGLIGGVAMQLELWQPGGAWSADQYSRMLGVHGLLWIALGAPALAGCFGRAAIVRLLGARCALGPIAWVGLALWVIGLVATIVALPRQVDTGWTLYTPYQEDMATSFDVGRVIGPIALAAAGLAHAVHLGAAIARARDVAPAKLALAAALVIAIAVACLGALVGVCSLAPSPAFVQAATGLTAVVLVTAALDTERPLLALIAIACAAAWAFTPLRVLGVGVAGIWIALAMIGGARRPVAALVVLGIAPVMLVQIGARVLLELTSDDSFLHDTHFEVGAHHSLGAIVAFAGLVALHAWGSMLVRRIPHAVIAWIGAGVLGAGTLLHVYASLRIGLRGMPRRYWDYDPEFASGHMLSGVGAAIAIGGLVLLAVAWVAGRSDRSGAT